LSIGICSPGKNWWTEITLCDSALSWCKIELQLHKFGLLFFYTFL
jgi:hypothetical protein